MYLAKTKLLRCTTDHTICLASLGVFPYLTNVAQHPPSAAIIISNLHSFSITLHKFKNSNCRFFLWCCDPALVMASSFLRFLDHTLRRTTVGRTPLDEWSARRRDLYLTTHNSHKRQTSMLPVGFEPTISAGERPQTYALDRAATGIGNCKF